MKYYFWNIVKQKIGNQYSCKNIELKNLHEPDVWRHSVAANDWIISLKNGIELENVHVSRTGNTVVNKRINRCVVNLNNDLILFDNPDAMTHSSTMERKQMT